MQQGTSNQTVVEDAAAPDGVADQDDPGSGEPPKGKSKRHGWHRLPTYTFAGTTGALIFAWASFTPTLVPRSPLFQGLVAGVSAALGYAAGLIINWVIQQFSDQVATPQTRRRAWWVLLVVGVIGSITMVLLGSYWQSELRELMDMDDSANAALLLVVAVTLAMFVLIIWIVRFLITATRWTIRQVNKIMPPAIARLLGVAAVVVLSVTLIDGVLLQGIMSVLDSSFKTLNQETTAGTEPPDEPELSGSQDSLVSWDALGRKGRDFVAGALTPEEINEFTGGGAIQPIRAYAGLEDSDEARDRAQLVLEELKRTGGFDREVLVVATTTGTGWVDDQAIWPVEYMYNGNTATASMQYSYLPSWLSFLVDRPRAQEAGRAMFDAVYGHWVNLPSDDRPKLYVFGESLGSFGGEAAFSGIDDIQNRVDGVFFAGPPNSNTLWSEFVEARDPDSTMAAPVFEGGEAVRFGATPEQLQEPGSDWEKPRMAYLQHSSDPIVWWTPSLLLTEPDWLKEERGADVLPDTKWLPLVTFFQVSADLAAANSVPDGHGHKYGIYQVGAWAAIAAPPGWTDAKTQELTDIIDARPTT